MAASLFRFTIPLLLLSVLAASARNEEDARALAALRRALDPAGRVLGSWNPSGDPCGGSFVGVTCDTAGRVTAVSLQGRGLSGSLPPAVAGLRRLQGLYLHYNGIKGPIPREIGKLSELTDLYLDVNHLTGPVPVEIASMANLQVLQLGYNQLTGSIPPQLGNLNKLTVLAMQSNQLTGAIPATLGELTQLRRLDLSFNSLFGSIPSKIAEVPLLEVFDIRNNTLSGSVPVGLRRMNGGFQYMNNKGLCGVGFSLLELCPSSEDGLKPSKPEPFGPDGTVKTREVPQSVNPENCSGSRCSKSANGSEGVLIVAVVAVVIGAAFCGLFAFSWYRRQKQKIGSSLEVSDSRLSTDHFQQKEACRRSASPLISVEYSNSWDPLSGGGVGSSGEVGDSFRFNLEEVECATQYFSDVNLLGKSGFAATYKGILRDGSVVAVKSLNKTSCKQEESDFLRGLKMLSLLRHDNLVSLRGFCCSRGRGECFLVYDFMVNGCLSQYLDVKDGSSASVLDWPTRVSIVRGIAKGIEYLHSKKSSKPPVVHQNISAEKILLDHHFAPRLSVPGLHKLLADDVVFSTLKASAAMGYLAPEYATTGRFTDKSDVFAFGIVVLQVITGKRDVSQLKVGAAAVSDLDGLVDGNLNGVFSRTEAARLAAVAAYCTSEVPNQRPTMEAVVQQLSH
ncbi:probable leucine-rich repeat receptor-like protein kinase At5g63930 [Setaria italica]|uniref:Protein kinase domain-containing protein n=1 Tax=Setaria italica TaxID=4555 RepID=K3XVP1_SETIT|nr:probable leucine-rich repeat receptor-like protein kinase At5g63930 [Setaria italica]